MVGMDREELVAAIGKPATKRDEYRFRCGGRKSSLRYRSTVGTRSRTLWSGLPMAATSSSRSMPTMGLRS